MSKFICVKPNLRNAGGFSSKAYTVRRWGSSVVVKYGSVESVGARGGCLQRANKPRRYIKRCGSKTKAARLIATLVARRLYHRYERLPGKVRIYTSPLC